MVKSGLSEIPADIRTPCSRHVLERLRHEEVLVPTYETLFITPPNLTDEETSATVDMLAAIVTDGGGNMVAREGMGRRRLAYPIQKFEDGIYGKFLYESESEVPKELERRGRLSDKVLRALTVRLTEEWAEDAKVQSVLAAERRAEAEARAKIEAEEKAKQEAEAAAAAAAMPAPAPAEDSEEEAPAAAADAEQPADAEDAAEEAPADEEAPAELEPEKSEDPA